VTAGKGAAFYWKTFGNIEMGCARTFLRVALPRSARIIFQNHARKCSHRLSLALLVALIFTDDIDDALATHNLAVLADLLDRRTYFHDLATRTRAPVPEQIRLLQ
jgi:hypothetical protein